MYQSMSGEMNPNSNSWKPRGASSSTRPSSSSSGDRNGRKNESQQGKLLAMQIFSYEEVGKKEKIDRDTSETGAFKIISQTKYKGPKMTRAQYCLANNRFLVSKFIDQYSESLYNPDVGLPWECVECVSSSDEETCCSICLGDLFLPVVTICGHTFCRICALRYLYYDSDGVSTLTPSQKCPLCNSHLSLRDLRPLTFLPRPIAPEGFQFRLLCIEKGSMFARPLPYSGSRNLSKGSHKGEMISGIPVSGSREARFSRVVLGSVEEALDQISRERESILAFHKQCLVHGKSETSSFAVDNPADIEYLPAIAQALELLQEREEQLHVRHDQDESRCGKDKVLPSPQAPRESVAAMLAASAAESRTNSDFLALGGLSDAIPFSGKAEALDKKVAIDPIENVVQVPLVSENGPVYFYQCDSGAFVFLHPICMRCLLTDAEKREEEKGERYLPSILSSFKVLQQESVRIDASTRSRIPYLRHLPEHCDLVYLVEIELAGLVKPETYSLFQEELNKRKQRRKKAKQAQQKERRSDIDRELAQNLQREEMQARHRDLAEKEERDLEALKRGPKVGGKGKEKERLKDSESDDDKDDDWPSGGITAVVETHGEVHSYKNIISTMGYFPELGSTPPPPSIRAWAISGNRSSSFEEQGGEASSAPRQGAKKGKKANVKGEKMDLLFSFA